MYIVANWKTYFSYDQSLAWITNHGKELSDTLKQTDHQFILCPSFDALACIRKKTDSILYGAQDCSPYPSGAYTGEVLAQSLAEIGCRYGIIGHGERRELFHETTLLIILKLEQLMLYKIQPIICIGETEQDYQADNALNVVTTQLIPIVQYARKHFITHLYIAYEPMWAIGANAIAPKIHLDRIANHIQNLSQQQNIKITLLYGGSIQSSTISRSLFESFQGLLVGKASTDFQELKKIILSV